MEKTVWRFLKKLKIELPYDLAIPLLGTYPKVTKTLVENIHATWMDLDSITFNEISQTEKDKYCMILLICRI